MWKHPFTCSIAGPTKSGKTQFAKKFITNVSQLITPKPEKIIFCFSEWQPAYEELNRIPELEFCEGLPDIAELKRTQNQPKLVVLDDLMHECSKNQEKSSKLFTRGSHHWNCSVINILQNLFYSGLRTSRINSHYLVLLKCPSDQLQISTLARQLYPGQQKYFLESYQDACNQPYGYLVVDLTPETPDDSRLKTNIFPDEIGFVYLPKL
jgi:hypothetical protein